MKKLVRSSLNEAHLSNINLKDINIKQFIKEQNNKNFLGPFVASYMEEEHNEYFNWDEDEDQMFEIIESSEFKQWIEYELEYQFDNLRDKFSNLIRNSKITLYRAMTVVPNYIDLLTSGKVKRVGEYYSYDFDGAESHWSDGNKDETIFEININEEYVNWVETFRLNLEHDFYNEEKEIRLFKNTPVNIVNIWWNKEQLDKSSINKINQFNITT